MSWWMMPATISQFLHNAKRILIFATTLTHFAAYCRMREKIERDLQYWRVFSSKKNIGEKDWN
jgi:hypothetical protein